MKILLWAPFGAGTHYWGPGTSAYRLYQNNKDKNIKITLVHSSSLQSQFPEVYSKQIKIGNLEKKSTFNSIVFIIKSLIWIIKNHHKYDVFHGISAFYFTFIPAILFTYYKKNAFIKITGQRGGFGSNSKISKLLGISTFRIKMANRITGYISISSDITKILKENGVHENKIHYIPNGVDTSRFYPLSDEEKTKLRNSLGVNNIFTIAYIGGLTENKRVIEIVKALELLITRGLKIQLLIVGPDRSGGIVIKEICNYVESHNLTDNCIYIAHTSEPEIYFTASDLFVLNSEHEGLSNSLLEAMASGLPCIGTKASGTVDLIEEGYNGYFTDSTPQQIADKVDILYSNKKNYSKASNNARKKIEDKYSSEFIFNKHIQLFKKNND